MSTLLNVIRTAELRNKILFTLFMIGIYRLGVQIPSPGVSLDGIQSLRDQSTEANGGVFGYLNLLTGGGLGSLSIFSLGILPYITASIIIQILTVAIPKLEEWQAQGAVGQRKITQWTRYVSIMLALVQSSGIVFIVHRNPEQFFGVDIGLFPEASVLNGLLAVCCITVGTAIVMWMGELITQKGIGNGMSVLIFASVVAALPSVGIQIYNLKGWLWVAVSIVLLAILCAGIVFVENGQRKIPVKFSKRVVGRKQTGGNSSFIPLKVNQAGVIPVIFASSLLQLPSLITNALPQDEGTWTRSVSDFITDNLFQPDNLGYILVFGLMIVGFSYFYNAIQFDPARRADDLRKQGGFIPPMRPGPETEKYLTKILNRITFPGSLFLAIVALIPSAALARLLGSGNGTAAGFSGVSVLISVGVALELMKQVNNQLMARNYEGFLK